MPTRPAPALDLATLDLAIRRSDVMPTGTVVSQLGEREYRYLAPRMPKALRVTTDSDYFEQHSDSVELWSPGSPVFPDADEAGEGVQESPGEDIMKLLRQADSAHVPATP